MKNTTQIEMETPTQDQIEEQREFWDFSLKLLGNPGDYSSLRYTEDPEDIDFIPTSPLTNFATSEETGNYRLGTLDGLKCLETRVFGLYTYIIST
jgi:hypothetical protein